MTTPWTPQDKDHKSSRRSWEEERLQAGRISASRLGLAGWLPGWEEGDFRERTLGPEFLTQPPSQQKGKAELQL